MAVIVGVLYLVIGLVTAELANHAGSIPLRTAWRASAFVLSAIVFAWHVRYEHVRRGAMALKSAQRAALAVAIGGFLLAASANVHSMMTHTGNRGLLSLALVVWPLMLGLPAFVAAWVAAIALDRMNAK